MASPNIKRISECFIQPHCASQESKQPFYLTPTDLAMLSAHYIQKGLLFIKPPEANSANFLETLLAKLKYSLSLALVHFYPLAGRLVTKKEQDPHLYLVYVDCSNSPGAKFIHASLDMPISDILSPTDVPLVVQSLFDHDRAVNHDGHTTSLLTAQVTELVDGVFIGLSMNHCLGDGTSYWHFFNTWSELFQAQEKNVLISEISNPPVLDRWFPEGHGPIISLPFTDPSEFIDRFEAPKLRERMFHFSAESLAKLKAKASSECETSKISSFQALSALLWRTITRARLLPSDQETSCRLAANSRARLDPPLPPNYFGNSIYPIRSEVIKSGELLEHGLGWAAWKLHQAVVNLNDQALKDFLNEWLRSPTVFTMRFFDPFSVMMGSSPRFDMYKNEFGMGKAVALRSGYANKFSGKVSSFQGREAGSIDLEVCLPPEVMRALESDDELMEAASVPSYE
ncbi:putative acetyltransferase [Rosa sericea]